MLNVPLSVRLTTAAGDKHVTRRLRDLSFRSVVPGGYASAAMSFDQPLAVNDPAVGIYGKAVIYDDRTAATVWEGRQEDSGRGAGSDGQVWSLNCFGPSALAADNPITVCYVDNSVEGFFRAPSTGAGLQTGTLSTTDDDPPQLIMTIAPGTVLATGDAIIAQNRAVLDCGQQLARVYAAWTGGANDANYTVEARIRTGISGTETTAASAALTTAGGTLSSGSITSADNVWSVRIRRDGAAATELANTKWVSCTVAYRGKIYGSSGALLAGAGDYTSNGVLASEVVTDLLSRVLTQFDLSTASIATTSYVIDQLTYLDPTAPTQILEDLMALESAYYWAAWESGSNGKYRFEWSAWPTAVRYETSITGDFDSPGSVGDLYNQVLVRYRDRNGRTRSVTRTLAQADLDNAGLTRTGMLDLGDNIGSKANAQQAGDRFLLDHNTPPNAGTLAITQPILDLVAGRMVQPWEIIPGELIRVRGVLPRVDALNATDRDAVTVFRLISTDYNASSNTCTAGLDSYSRSMANQVFEAHRRIDRLRKR